ncbi:MAG: phosphoglycerate kinase [Flavobacteriaceae bacterium]|nr:phosphoglycerate kinase [Flavobacteriaceae bacterium]MBT4113702.1 phosphoglycerate kinase [Flavobacteriaceae bacterium]MBT4614130.1 phosphoglycerate kinase [Flavobacteriaceae bacterium]MBT7881607.1 phosphoglycerate kinase [Flavobacteriaceae bacterium]
MKFVTDINFKNKKALIRVDFNVPLDSHKNVADNSRILAAKPTIEHIINNGGACVLMSHLGRPNGQDQNLSLKHILKQTQECLSREVVFISDCIGPEVARAVSAIKPGDILMLENLRFYDGEIKGDEKFSKELSKAGDVYVNDAFGTTHREHASTSTIAKFFIEKCAGLLLKKELESIDKVLVSKKQPVTAIIGGAKVSSKIPIIKNLLSAVDNLLIGGGMAYTFIKSQGGEVGASISEPDKTGECLEVFKEAERRGVSILLPKDVIAAEEFKNESETKIANSNKISEGWMGLDIGPETEKAFNKTIQESQTILWNGPMGVFEMNSFSKGTKAVAESVVEATKNGAFSLVGGGDSVAALKKFNLFNKISCVSTGGGAMLESLEGKTLPGIKALRT